MPSPQAPQAAPQAGPQQPAAQQQAASPAIPQPGSLGTFGPTQRPNEPLTHGLPSGPGGGPEVLAAAGVPPTDYLGQLRAIYLANPTEPLRELIAFNEPGMGQ